MLTRDAEGVDAVTVARDRDNDAVKTIERYQPGILPVETKRSPRRNGESKSGAASLLCLPLALRSSAGRFFASGSLVS